MSGEAWLAPAWTALTPAASASEGPCRSLSHYYLHPASPFPREGQAALRILPDSTSPNQFSFVFLLIHFFKIIIIIIVPLIHFSLIILIIF